MLIKSSAEPVTKVKAPPKKAVVNQTVWEAAKSGAIAALKESIADCEGLIEKGPLPKASPSPCWSRKKPLKSEKVDMILEVGIKTSTTFVDDVFGAGRKKARFEPAKALQWMKDALAAIEALSSKDDGELAEKLHSSLLTAKQNFWNKRNAMPPSVDPKTGKTREKVIMKYNPRTDKIEAV